MIVRQLRQSDKEKWISFFQGLSSETIENRCGHIIKKCEEEAIEYWEIIIKGICLIVEIDDEIIGCIELYLDSEGEIAIVITDKYQNKGIGSLLMNKIEEIARKHKLKLIYFRTLPSNIRMKKIAKKHNFIYNKYHNYEYSIYEKELK